MAAAEHSYPAPRADGHLRWWERNREIEAWVRTHPSDAHLLLPWFLDPAPPRETPEQARRRVTRARNRLYHAMRRLGARVKYHWSLRVHETGGRPIDVWCGWSVPQDTLKGHELPLSYFCRAYREFAWIRGNARIRRELPDLLPDAVMLGDKRRFVEYDSGSEREATYKEHMRRFAGTGERVLIVAPNVARMEQIIGWGESVNHAAFYTTLEAAMARPYEKIWRNADGQLFALPRPSR